MRDEEKNKKQLIEELKALRLRVEELEKAEDKRTTENSDLLNLVLDATNDGIWEWNIQTGEAYFSPSYYTMLGYEVGEFSPSYESWRSLLHPDDLEAAERVVQNAAVKHFSFTLEFRMRYKDGTWRWILSRGRAIKQDDKGQSVRMVGSLTDITDRKVAEESLRLTQCIFENAPIGIWRMGTDSRILDVNDVGAKSLGYSREELRTMSLYDFVPGFEATDWASGVSILNDTRTRVVEDHHRRRNGEVFPVQIIEKMIRYGDEEFHVSFVYDITERKEAEDSLRMARTIIERANSGIYLISSEGDIEKVNPKAAELLGYTKEELDGLSIADIDSNVTPEIWDVVWNDLLTHKSRFLEREHRKKDGSLIPVEIYSNLLKYKGSLYAVCFVQDITARKANEEALREKDRMLHDIGRLVKIGAWKYDVKTGKTTSTDEVARIYELDLDIDTNIEKGVRLFCAESRKKFFLAFDAAVQHSIPFDLELEINSAKGRHKWVRIVGQPVMKDGQVTVVQGAFQDISDRKENEARLREKDRLLQDIGRLVKVGAWEFDAETMEATSTDEVARIYEFDPDMEMSVGRGLSLYCEESRKEIEKALDKAIKYGTPYDLELEMVSAKGNHKWVRTICNPVIVDGRVTKVQGSFQDITLRKEAEILLKESEKKYRALIEHSPLGICIINSDGIIVDCNPAFTFLLGYERGELLGKELADITDPEDMVIESRMLIALGEGEQSSFSIEKRYLCKNGGVVWANTTVAKIYDICGQGLFYFGFTEDISRRKQMEKEREHLIEDLKKALAEIKELRGYIPICSNCKKIRDDEGYWQQVEEYISDRTDALFSHSLCPECSKKLYPDIYDEISHEDDKDT